MSIWQKYKIYRSAPTLLAACIAANKCLASMADKGTLLDVDEFCDTQQLLSGAIRSAGCKYPWYERETLK